MEQHNQVPMDITRRRTLAQILEIPPLLLGLAAVEAVTYRPLSELQVVSVPTVLRHPPLLDLASYERDARARWLLSYSGEESLVEFGKHMRELEQWERQSSGDFQHRVRHILNSYYQLASDINRHQGKFADAWCQANQAVRVTRLLGQNDFLAAALYRRGYTYLEWAVFGDHVAVGVMKREPERKKLEAALKDFEAALPLARAQLKGAIFLELSRANALSQNCFVSLSFVKQAGEMVDVGSSSTDPLEQILREGALSGLNEGMYLLGKTATLIALGHTTTAIEQLDDLMELKNGRGIARNQTRRLAYADALRAEASLGTKDYLTTAISAMNAFQTFQDIKNIERIAWIKSIAQRLAEKDGNNPEVKRLGRMLAQYYRPATPGIKQRK